MVDGVGDVHLRELDRRLPFDRPQHRRIDRAAGALQIDPVEQIAAEFRFGLFDLFGGEEPRDFPT